MEIDGVLIKKYRKKLGLSQTELGDLLGVSFRTIQNYEKGGVIPKSKHKAIRNIVNIKNEINVKGTKNTKFLHSDGSKVTFEEIVNNMADNFEEIIEMPELEKPIYYFKLKIINEEFKEIMKSSKK